MNDSQTVAARLMNGFALHGDRLVLDIDGYRIAVRSNSKLLLDRLAGYFSHFVAEGGADVEVKAIETSPIETGLRFRDWKREPGKVGRKDAVHDLPDGRLVRKVRSGMLFLQNRDHRIACGPCLQNDNQVINFLNSQYMNRLQQDGALICHASGVVIESRCLAIAGFSGGGKSSLMLHLLESADSQYLTNDRLFLRVREDGKARALGIAKMPRVNPGTMLSLPSLRPLLSEDRQAELRSWPDERLWNLEEKHDVDVDRIYGSGRITSSASLAAVLILNWRRDDDAPCTIGDVDLRARTDLLAAVMKSPGPFFQDRNGIFQADDAAVDAAPYLTSLNEIPIWEARGKIDFQVMADHCQNRMRSEPCPKSC